VKDRKVLNDVVQNKKAHVRLLWRRRRRRKRGGMRWKRGGEEEEGE
jgi:hypothetical protein